MFYVVKYKMSDLPFMGEDCMSTNAKIRTAVYIVILLILAYFSVGYSYGAYRAKMPDSFVDTNNINNVIVDGSDFTPFVNLAGEGINGLMAFVTSGIYIVIIFVVSLVLVIPFRLIALRKDSEVSKQEADITKCSFIAVSVLSLLLGLILTKGSVLGLMLVYTGIWMLILFFVYTFWVIRRASL